MRQAVADDLSKSAKAFKKLVWPEISDWFDGGELVTVEAVSSKGMKQKLDTLAGIDAWHIKHDKGLRGVASRVQWTNRPYNTFTVRTERESGISTEYEKRKDAIESGKGWLYPEITVQAYVNTEKTKLLSVGAIRTKVLIDFIDTHDVEVKTSIDRQSNEWAKFYCVSWSNINGVRVSKG